MARPRSMPIIDEDGLTVASRWPSSTTTGLRLPLDGRPRRRRAYGCLSMAVPRPRRTYGCLSVAVLDDDGLTVRPSLAVPRPRRTYGCLSMAVSTTTGLRLASSPIVLSSARPRRDALRPCECPPCRCQSVPRAAPRVQSSSSSPMSSTSDPIAPFGAPTKTSSLVSGKMSSTTASGTCRLDFAPTGK